MAFRMNSLQQVPLQRKNITSLTLVGLILGIVIGLLIGLLVGDISIGITVCPALGLLSGALLGLALDTLETVDHADRK